MFKLFLMAVALVGSVGTGHNESLSTLGNIAATRNGIVPGNLIVVAVTVGNGVTITNVSDGTTTVTTADVTFNSSLVGQQIALYSFPNHAGGNKTFTATFSATQPFRSIVIVELQGADTVSPKEGTASAQGTSAAPSTGNISPTPTLDGEYIVGYVLSATTATPSGAFSTLFADSVNTANLEGEAQASLASVAGSWTMTSGIWGAVAASYKPALIASILPPRGFSGSYMGSRMGLR